ncbi:malonate decarboxylase subunit delta [Polaromonas hydrogenivorans]|uniref:Malonate decarboxylase acyl carrier protein n=1 Tax=Polaromonas hydrogenivorans TaxID=335476 RepID=A0AAU7LR60_9BURK
METFDFQYPAGQPATGRVMVGVVGSGDLEVLLEPGNAGQTRVRVTTSVNGYGAVWQAQLDRLFKADAQGWPAARLEINDFGATPGVVGMRVAQAFQTLDDAAAGEKP